MKKLNLVTDKQLGRLVDVGLTACRRGQVARGRDIFEGLLVYAPGFAPAAIGLAFSYVVVDGFEPAETILKEMVLEHNPDDVDALIMLGLNYFLAKRHAEAGDVFNKLSSGEGIQAELAAALACLL